MARLVQRGSSRSLKIRYGISLAIALVFLGWVLALYHMPVWGWGLTLMCLVHLSKSGRSAIPLSCAWLNVVIWAAAFHFAMPVGFVWRNAKYWSASLIALWIVATVIVVAIAKVPKLYALPQSSQLFSFLPALLMSCGLGLGLLLYQLLLYQGVLPQ